MKTYLHLETGERLEGISFGSDAPTEGEMVFSTGMTGYVESLTDPSFAGQILVFTYPLIGNYGVPRPRVLSPHLLANAESERIWANGVVVGETCKSPSHYQSIRSFQEWLTESHIPGISGIDTRALTHIIREKGCMRGQISQKPSVSWNKPCSIDWVRETSCIDTIKYPSKEKNAKHIVLVDCGVKHGVLRSLLQTGYAVTRIPWDRDPRDIHDIDGVVFSNGPGDPKACQKIITHARGVLSDGIPCLGICLGHQILSLAIGADTYKLPYGHRSINQPCLNVMTNKAYVTSQNHGFAVDGNTLPGDYTEWFINLNDKTNEGMKHKTKPIQSVQFHPEGYPGPSDTSWIWKFI